MNTTHKKTLKRRSIVREESYGSVRIFWLDREAALQQIRTAATRLVQERPEVVAVYLFGSLAKDRATPRSDADLLIVLRYSPIACWFERGCEYGDYFDEVEMPCELFCYTLDELPKVPLARNAMPHAVLIAGTPVTLEVSP
jgi:hypothetical protein